MPCHAMLSVVHSKSAAADHCVLVIVLFNDV